MKLVSWNILEGGCRDWKDGILDAKRWALILQFVQEEDPDVLVLNEALWGGKGMECFIDYAKLLRMDHTLYHAYDGAWGNMILSKTPFLETRVMHIHNRSGLVARLDGLTVGTYHPHPSRYPAHKSDDIEAMLQMIGQGPALLMGDFNAISPDDAVDEVKLTQAFARFSSHPASSLARFTDGGRWVFDTLKKHGWSDCATDHTHTIPTRLLGDDKSSAMRIDHCWKSAGVRAVAQVVQNDTTHFASDHYPIVARIDL